MCSRRWHPAWWNFSLQIVSLLNACTPVVWAVRIWGSEESGGDFLSPPVSELTATGKQFDEISLVVRKNSRAS